MNDDGLYKTVLTVAVKILLHNRFLCREKVEMGQPNPDAEWLAQHGTVEELRQSEGYLGGLLPGGNVADLGFHMLP